MKTYSRISTWLALFLTLALMPSALAQQQDQKNFPWMNTSLSPDERADMVVKQMTLDEKINMVHGQGMLGWANKTFPNMHLGNGGAGFVLAIERSAFPVFKSATQRTASAAARKTDATQPRCPQTLPRPQAGTRKAPANTAR